MDTITVRGPTGMYKIGSVGWETTTSMGDWGAEPCDQAEKLQEHEDIAALRGQRAMDAELLWAVEQDKHAMTKYCKKANKRRAFPPWGTPTEMTWTILNPTVNP